MIGRCTSFVVLGTNSCSILYLPGTDPMWSTLASSLTLGFSSLKVWSCERKADKLMKPIFANEVSSTLMLARPFFTHLTNVNPLLLSARIHGTRLDTFANPASRSPRAFSLTRHAYTGMLDYSLETSLKSRRSAALPREIFSSAIRLELHQDQGGASRLTPQLHR